jgi:hypothetical protein
MLQHLTLFTTALLTTCAVALLFPASAAAGALEHLIA